MSLYNIRRISLMDNYVSLHTSPKKQRLQNKLYHLPCNNIKSQSTYRQKMIQDPVVKLIQWRKNAHQNVVRIKNQKYSIIRTVNKCIKIPSNYQTQKIIRRLDIIKDLPITESMLIILSVLQGYTKIKSFLGYIAFELRFCGINTQGKVKVWINSDFRQNQPQGQIIHDQGQAVLKIIQQIKKISANQFSQFYSYYLRNARKNICDFKYTISLIKSYLNCTKLIIPQKIVLDKFRYKNSFRNTPQNHKSPTHNQKKNQRFSLAPDFSLKDTQNFIRNRPMTNIKNWTSLTSIKVKQGLKQQSLEIDRRQRRNSQIVKQFSFKIKPQDLIKHSQISTTMKSNSNKRSTYIEQGNGLDWSLKTFNKGDKLPTHQSQNEFPKFFRNQIQQQDNRIQLQEGILQQCNSNSSPKKGQDSVIIRKQKEKQILKRNKWTNKISSLFVSKQVKQSQVLGKQPSKKNSPMKTHKLDKWARIIGQSVLYQN